MSIIVTHIPERKTTTKVNLVREQIVADLVSSSPAKYPHPDCPDCRQGWHATQDDDHNCKCCGRHTREDA
jgi:tRNA(Ile2) C34 agmatinyltransferase TiaS